MYVHAYEIYSNMTIKYNQMQTSIKQGICTKKEILN